MSSGAPGVGGESVGSVRVSVEHRDASTVGSGGIPVGSGVLPGARRSQEHEHALTAAERTRPEHCGSPEHGGRVVRVLIDSPLPQLDQLFDYAIPERLSEMIRVGVRVRVPLRSGGRIANAWVIEVVTESAFVGKLSELDDVVSAVPVLTPEVWRLVRAAADRAAGNASDILRLAVPTRYVRAEKTWAAAAAVGSLTAAHPGADEARSVPSAAVDSARSIDGGVSTGTSVGAPAVVIAGYEPGRVERGIDSGERLALAAAPQPLHLPTGHWVAAWASTLAHAAAYTVAQGKSSILVVPDYRDQEQLEHALAALVHTGVIHPDRILRTDARQPGGTRFRDHLRATTGRAHIIIGNRSVVYAPADRLGLIALWDDGDPLHAEPLAPYVHARDAALIRQEQSGAALIFLNHSGSVELERLCEIGWVHRVPPIRPLHPRVIVTENQETPEPGSARIPSLAWRHAQDAVKEGPVLVQVARPGHTLLYVCGGCRQVARCSTCHSALMTPRSRPEPVGAAASSVREGMTRGPARHRVSTPVLAEPPHGGTGIQLPRPGPGKSGPSPHGGTGSRGTGLRGTGPHCPLCGPLSRSWCCPECDSTQLRAATIGATRTAEELGRAFPRTLIVLADGEHSVLTVPAKPALVIATRGAEPVAEGGYRAILLLDGDRMLLRESLRVAEDCLRWWSNAAALAAPQAPVFLVGVGGQLASALAGWRQSRWTSAEFAARRELRFPPAVRVATLTAPPSTLAAVIAAVQAEVPEVDALATIPVEQELSRVILRFDYAQGASVARALRAEKIRLATARRRPVAGRSPSPLPKLRVCFDDLTAL